MFSVHHICINNQQIFNNWPLFCLVLPTLLQRQIIIRQEALQINQMLKSVDKELKCEFQFGRVRKTVPHKTEVKSPVSFSKCHQYCQTHSALVDCLKSPYVRLNKTKQLVRINFTIGNTNFNESVQLYNQFLMTNSTLAIQHESIL